MAAKSALPPIATEMLQCHERRDVPIAFFAATQEALSLFVVSDEPPYGAHVPVEEPFTASDVALHWPPANFRGMPLATLYSS